MSRRKTVGGKMPLEQLFSGKPKTPTRYADDKDGLDPQRRARIEELKQRQNCPLDPELQDSLDDPFFMGSE